MSQNKKLRKLSFIIIALILLRLLLSFFLQYFFYPLYPKTYSICRSSGDFSSDWPLGIPCPIGGCDIHCIGREKLISCKKISEE